MAVRIDYYFSVASPWSYLGSSRFMRIVRDRNLPVHVRPVDLDRVFAATGGIQYGQRSPQRRAYRQLDLARWSRHLDVPLRLEPHFYPVDRAPASRLIIAAREAGEDALRLAHAILQAIWAEDRDIADWNTLAQITESTGLAQEPLIRAAQTPEMLARFGQETDRAIAAGIFGAPSYVVEGEIFWGQDRLDFLERRLT